MLQDETPMNDDEIDYLYANAEILYDMGEALGWMD
jgi:hypothetical protein